MSNDKALTKGSGTEQAPRLALEQSPPPPSLADQIKAINEVIDLYQTSYCQNGGPNDGKVCDPNAAHSIACLEETKRILTELREEYCTALVQTIARMPERRADA